MTRAGRRRRYYSEVKRLTAEKTVERRYGHTLDHVVPVSFGFKNEIPPKLIASRENLQLIPFQQNLAKSSRMTAEAIALLETWGLFDLAFTEMYKLKR